MGKYLVSSDKANSTATNRAFRKPGYFASETELVHQIRDATGTGKARHPICCLVEAADDIVYLAADVEDSVKKGVLSWTEVREQLTDSGADSVRDALKRQEHILKAGQPTVSPALHDDIHASAFRTAAISVMVEGAFKVFKTQYGEIMHGQYPGALLQDSDAKELASCLRKVGIKHVYPTRSTLTLELMGRQVIGDLMDIFWEGAEVMPTTGDPDTSEFAGKAAALFSENYRLVFQKFAHENEHSAGALSPFSVGNRLHLRYDRLVRKEASCRPVQWTLDLVLPISSRSCWRRSDPFVVETVLFGRSLSSTFFRISGSRTFMLYCSVGLFGRSSYRESSREGRAAARCGCRFHWSSALSARRSIQRHSDTSYTLWRAAAEARRLAVRCVATWRDLGFEAGSHQRIG